MMMFDAVIGRLNLWGGEFARIAWPLFWQSSILITGMFLLDVFLRRRLRPSVRHAFWLVVLVKLLLPPSFALPSGIGWWLRPREVAPVKPPVASYIVTYGPGRAATPLPAVSYVLVPVPRIRLSSAAWALLGAAGISVTLLLVMLGRWQNLRHQLRRSQPAPIWLEEMVHDARRKAGCRRSVRLMLTHASISPVLCGLFKPVVVLPATLADRLAPPQLRAVLLHELFHLRNGDVWVNCFQSLLQIVFWWHPILWLANARIRRIREEVVDDSVRLALAEEAETYAPTLLEVARLALARPLATLGLVGILESRHALKQRVDRLVNFPAPRRVGLSTISGVVILAFASVALPMGQAPPKNVTPIRRQPTTIYNADQKLYYTFDQKFWDYFGSNGVDAVIQTFAQSNPGSKFLRYPEYPRVSPFESERFNSQPGISNTDGAILKKNSPVDTANSTWEFHPLTENGFIEYDLPTGIGVATNGAEVTHGGTTISADRITVNQQTGEVFAGGSVKIRSGATNPAVEFETVSENGWIKYDAATGTATATNGAVLRQGGQVVARADNITFDATNGFLELTGNPALEVRTNASREAGKVIVNGHYNTRSASGNPILQLAQVQPTLGNPTQTIHTSSGKRSIFNKLNAIRLDHVAFDNLPLSEVVNYLRDEAKKRDPEGKGVNFILNPNTDLDGPPAGTIDPATGQQVAAPQGESADINSVSIKLLPPLEDVRMIDVLDAITKVADKRIRYSIEDYGISFRLAGYNEPVQLFTRVIKVDPNAFAQGLESVVGFSVGNFQTGGQGGGGGQQGNNSGVTVPRVQVAPNAAGQGGQAGAGGAQGGVGGISGVTRPTAMPTPQAVRQFFANAGVDLTPPKNVFFTDTKGSLLVHATLNDLDIIEKAVMALNAGSVIASTSTARPTTASVTETPSKPALPQTNLAKVPLGDLPVVGKALTRTIEVSAANSPQQIPNANASNTEKLLTETIGVGDPIIFSEWVKKTAGLADNVSPQETMDAFRKILLDRGLQLAPPANVIYIERNGILFVRAIRPEIDVIEQIVQEVNRSSPQISAQANPPNWVPQVNIQARFVEVPEDDTKAISKPPDFISVNADTNSSTLAILTDPQFRVVLHALETRDGVDVVSEHNVTTVSGRQAQIQNAEVQSIVKLNPQALIPPGVASSNALLPEVLYSGPLLDVVPYVAEGGDKIQLTITATVTEFVGYDPPPENSEDVPVYLDGQVSTIKRPHPQTHVRTMQAAVNIYDGQTVMLGRPKDEMITLDKDGKALSAPSTSKKNLLVFVTATLIDSAGNPIHGPGSFPSSAPGH